MDLMQKISCEQTVRNRLYARLPRTQELCWPCLLVSQSGPTIPFEMALVTEPRIWNLVCARRPYATNAVNRVSVSDRISFHIGGALRHVWLACCYRLCCRGERCKATSEIPGYNLAFRKSQASWEILPA